MSLRSRVAVAFVAVLASVVVMLGVLVVRTTESVLIDQADAELRAAAARVAGRNDDRGQDARSDATLSRPTAIVSLDADATMVDAQPSGFADAPDPLPSPDGVAIAVSASGAIVTVDSVDGSLRYRAISVAGADDVTVVAVPIDAIDAAMSRLARWLLFAGAVAALIGAGVTWLVVRRGLRPVSDMADTAAAIAAGDLTERVAVDRPRSEIGQLSQALNQMLERLDSAFEQERAAQSQLQRFVADASHELRTPIAALQGYVELHRRGALDDPDDLADAMGRIRKESGRMQRLVDDLLLLAQLNRGTGLDTKPVDVVAIVGDSVANSAAIDPERPISYSGPDRAVVVGDEQRLEQVVANLLANARAHTPQRTPVEVIVDATSMPGRVRVDVVDAGPGIADADLDRVFDPFHRSGSATAGSGLGLAIVTAIVAAHGGNISVANEPGGGARFSLQLVAF